MKSFSRRKAFFLAMVFLWTLSSVLSADEPPVTGAETEKRFPPLVVPPGFQATLFACDPLVEYPSVISLGPKQATLFVAHDYVTGLGVEIVRRDEIRLIEDTDGDGYADKSTLYADGFNSLQGLAYHDGTVFAMHAPLLTALRDTDGDGVADQRHDLLSGLGLKPEDNRSRLHCANGVVVGHDGWLYLAVGDNGCDVQRPEGDRFVFHAGGILRCRHDGRDLHVFSAGLRNIYDIALDHELNVFVRDNENDGGSYMIRVCHCFHGSDHGYPYHYYERPDEAMPPLADLGRGSSAGGVCYLEKAFPEEYRGGLIFCEWGRAIVRYDRKSQGSGFAATQETDLAAGAENDPYGFKPTDLVVDRDGSLLISDWADGQRPKRGRARIYRISYTDQLTKLPSKSADNMLVGLQSESYHQRVAAQTSIERQGGRGLELVRRALKDKTLAERGRLHAIWILAHLAGQDAIEELLRIAQSDPSASVRAQAIRAIADLSDPVLIKHRLDAGRGDPNVAQRLSSLATGQPPQLMREIVVALGRLRWEQAPTWMRDHLLQSDPALEHAAMIALRRVRNWPAVMTLLDQESDAPMRTVALRAVAELENSFVVDQLILRLQSESNPQRQQQYADLLTRVYKKRAAWTYWGYRPAPRSANTVAWERTEAIEQALNHGLNKSDLSIRTPILLRMQQERIPTRLPTLARWLRSERDQQTVTAIFDSLTKHPPEDIRNLLGSLVLDQTYSQPNRLAALSMFSLGLGAESEGRLLELAKAINDGPVLAAALRQLGQRPRVDSQSLQFRKLDSPSPEVRAAAIEALSELNEQRAVDRLPGLLADADLEVRRAAASAAGQLRATKVVDLLLALGSDEDPTLRSVSLDSLRKLDCSTAVELAVRGLDHRQTQLSALRYLTEYGGPPQASAVAKVAMRDQSNEALAGVIAALSNWQSKQQLGSHEWDQLDRSIAIVQGESGVLLHWHLRGPLSLQDADANIGLSTDPSTLDSSKLLAEGWRSTMGSGGDARVNLPAPKEAKTKSAFLAVTSLSVDQPSDVQFLASSDGALEVWLNGRSIYQREKAASYLPQSDLFDATLDKGINRVVVRVVVTGKQKPAFSVLARRKSSTAEHERLVKLALTGRGNIERGKELFYNLEKSQCAKCHRIGEQGSRIGPDLTGVGGRFSRIHLIESILQPSRTIAPSYEPIALALADGRTLSGVKIAENETTLTLGDNRGKTLEIAKSDIEQQRLLSISIMPEGLEKKLSDREFLDLLFFLLSQEKVAGP